MKHYVFDGLSFGRAIDVKARISSAAIHKYNCWLLGTVDGAVFYMNLEDEDRAITAAYSRKIGNARVSGLHIIATKHASIAVALLYSQKVALIHIPSLNEVNPRDNQVGGAEVLIAASSGAHSMAYTGTTSDKLRLFFLVQSRVILFQIEENAFGIDFVRTSEINLENIPFAIRIGGKLGNCLCLAVTNSYVFVKVSTKGQMALASILQLDGPNSPCQKGRKFHVPLPNNPTPFLMMLFSGNKSEDENVDEPFIVPLKHDHWLVETNDQICQVSSFGAIINRKAMNEIFHADIPNQALQAPPFLLLSTSKGEIEIRAASEKIPKLQTLPSMSPAGTRFCGCRIIPSLTETYPTIAVALYSTRIVPVQLNEPVKALMKRLQDNGELDLALAIDTEADVKTSLELRKKIAIDFIKAGDHEKAIRTLQKSEFSLKEIIEIRNGVQNNEWSMKRNAKLWADYLFQMRRYENFGINECAPAFVDEAVIESLCFTDTEADRVKEILSNNCDVSSNNLAKVINDERTSLLQEEKQSALILLYSKREEHDNTLLVYEQRGKKAIEEIGNYLYDLACNEKYLVKNADIIYKHLTFLLQNCAKEIVLSILVNGCLSDGRSLDYLHENAPGLIILFLEECMKHRTKKDRSKVMEWLVDAIVVKIKISEGEELQIYKNKLLELLTKEKKEYDPTAFLERLPDWLWESRALLLGLLGRHKEALYVLTHDANDINAAERYCVNLPDADRGKSFTSLVGTCLETWETNPHLIGKGASLIQKREAHDVDIIGAMHNIAASAPLNLFMPYIVAALSVTTGRLRTMQEKKALLRSNILRIRKELMEQRRKHVVITRDRGCVECGKKIGESVFVILEDGDIVHYACSRE